MPAKISHNAHYGEAQRLGLNHGFLSSSRSRPAPDKTAPRAGPVATAMAAPMLMVSMAAPTPRPMALPMATRISIFTILPWNAADEMPGPWIRRGVAYPNNQEARKAAISHLPDMAGDVMPDGNLRKLTVLLLDEHRTPIFRATFSLEGEWLVANEPQE